MYNVRLISLLLVTVISAVGANHTWHSFSSMFLQHTVVSDDFEIYKKSI